MQEFFDSGPGHTIFVNSSPIADFTATPLEGLSPLTVTLIDRSYGAPTNLTWDFGDGSPATTDSSVIHTFTETGKEYSVTLTATNGHGSSTAIKNIRTLMGAESMATTPINGITVDTRFRGQFLTYNATLLPSFFPAAPTTTLISDPPPQYGWQNITFVTADSTGIRMDPSNNTYYANISRFFLTSNDTIATTTGSVPQIGNNWGVSYQINTTEYPSAASFKTETREDASAGDRAAFDDVASKVWPSGTLVRDIAYTATFTKWNIRDEGTCIINMSVAEDWVKGSAASVTEGRNYTYIMAFGFDTLGNKRGAILAKRYVTTNNGLDYYEVEVPESASLSLHLRSRQTLRSGNPFQLITLTVASHIGSGGGGEMVVASTPVAVQNTVSPEIKPTTLPDPGKTAKIYANLQGVITQATTLQSTDGLATVNIREGIVAKDSTGKALSSITIKAFLRTGYPPYPLVLHLLFRVWLTSCSRIARRSLRQ